MHFDVAIVVSHLSYFMTLKLGDKIAAVTPLGVGIGQTPAVYFKPGDRLELGIERLEV